MRHREIVFTKIQWLQGLYHNSNSNNCNQMCNIKLQRSKYIDTVPCSLPTKYSANCTNAIERVELDKN